MVNKRGESSNWNWLWILFIVGAIIVILAIYDYQSTTFSLLPWQAFSQNLDSGFTGFEDANVFHSDGAKFLDYIFGRIPNYLINTLGPGSETSAAIVIIGIWAMFFFIFADMFRMFGGFHPAINWLVAGLLTIIGANLKFISIISVYMLTVMAAFGALAVLFSLFLVIGLFLAFHFGGTEIRKAIMLRRAQDHAMRAVAGGKEVAGALRAMKEIERELERR